MQLHILPQPPIGAITINIISTEVSFITKMLTNCRLFCVLSVVVVMFPAVLSENTDSSCEPMFADDCFGDIEFSLREIIDVRRSILKRLTQKSMEEFCWVLDDALNCTSDIIDTDCSTDEGRFRFDAWLLALREVYFFLCGESLYALQELLAGIQCWNIDIFVNCTISTVGIGHVEDLFYTDLDSEECRKLRQSFISCNDVAKVSSCREQNGVEDKVHELITIFLESSKCNYNCGQIIDSSYFALIFLLITLYSMNLC